MADIVETRSCPSCVTIPNALCMCNG